MTADPDLAWLKTHGQYRGAVLPVDDVITPAVERKGIWVRLLEGP
jgi:hypothetical protein